MVGEVIINDYELIDFIRQKFKEENKEVNKELIQQILDYEIEFLKIKGLVY